MKRLLIEIVAALIAVAVMVTLCNRLATVRNDRDRYRNNTESLLSDVEHYRIRDSLSAARVTALELTAREYERYRAEDARLIADLTARNRELSAVSKAQTATILTLTARPADTVIVVRDSIRVPAVSVACGDRWYDFQGILTADRFDGSLQVRDSLLLTESIRRRRFLFWRTRRIRDRQLSVVSLNPHTQVEGVEHIVIDR